MDKSPTVNTTTTTTTTTAAATKTAQQPSTNKSNPTNNSHNRQGTLSSSQHQQVLEKRSDGVALTNNVMDKNKNSNKNNKHIQSQSQAHAIEVGKAMRIEQKDGSYIQGFIHAYDRGSTLVCVESIPSSEVLLISSENIKASYLLTTSKEIVRAWPNNINVVDSGRAKQEIDRVWHKKHNAWLQAYPSMTISQSGGVTTAHIKTHAQTVFDTLAKTMPCQWDNETIVILGSVRLDPPYDTSCISGNGDNGVVNRVKMILENESSAISKSFATKANGVNNSNSNK